MTSCARRWISALPRCTESKSRSAVLAPVAIEEAEPPPMPISMPGPPSWTSSAPAGTSAFVRVRGADVADAAREHDRLVVAADDAGHLLLVGAEVAGEVGPAELVVEGGRADRPLDHDRERRGDPVGPRLAALPRPLVPGRRRFETEKPHRPALGLAPRPVAPSSRISPPEPVAAPGKGEIAVGWLCVSTFISVCVRSSR